MRVGRRLLGFSPPLHLKLGRVLVLRRKGIWRSQGGVKMERRSRSKRCSADTWVRQDRT